MNQTQQLPTTIDPQDKYDLAWLGPVVKVHEIDGYPSIIEYVRDESNLANPSDTDPLHGKHMFTIDMRNRCSYDTIAAAILHVLTGDMDPNTRRYAIDHASMILGIADEVAAA